MAKFIFTNKAVSDLTEIWYYTYTKWSERQADTYYNMLLENCAEIAENPDIGRNYKEIVKGLFRHRAGKHIIFYRKINPNKIEITRVLHEKMDLKNRLLK